MGRLDEFMAIGGEVARRELIGHNEKNIGLGVRHAYLHAGEQSTGDKRLISIFP